jgi:hypothetical protein
MTWLQAARVYSKLDHGEEAGDSDGKVLVAA